MSTTPQHASQSNGMHRCQATPAARVRRYDEDRWKHVKTGGKHVCKLLVRQVSWLAGRRAALVVWRCGESAGCKQVSARTPDRSYENMPACGEACKHVYNAANMLLNPTECTVGSRSRLRSCASVEDGGPKRGASGQGSAPLSSIPLRAAP